MYRLVQIAMLLAVLGHGALAEVATPAAPLSAADLAFIDRVTWGVNETTAAEFLALGRDRWLDRQLHPGPRDRLPADADAQIAAMKITTQSAAEFVDFAALQQQAERQMETAQGNAHYQQTIGKLQRELYGQTVTRDLLRDLYSSDQLLEKMTWFWFNHFNVYYAKAGPWFFPLPDYEDTLRRHAFGRFRDILGATAIHPSMLYYLDNTQNAKGKLNENYAREIMELHTMGVGSGYTQGDVQELARILTGVGIVDWHDPHRDRTQIAADSSSRNFVRAGLFEFNPNRHDYLAKHFLGQTISRSGFAEVEQALDILAGHPATARYVSRKIAMFFVSDMPPDELVERMAAAFKKTGGDIANVLLVMFKSPEFEASLRAKEKFKDPMQFVLSAVRLGYGDKVALNTGPIASWLSRLGEPLHGRDTPDGYPLAGAAWIGSSQLTARFDLARQIGPSSSALFKAAGANGVDRPAFPQIHDALYVNAMQRNLSATTRAALDQAKSPQEWDALFLSSPEFMHF